MAQAGFRWLAACTVAVALAGTVLAGPEDYEGRPILAIEYDPPEQPLPREELDRLQPLKLNQPLRLADVRDAIERLYATGRYDDIAVDARHSDGGVILRFQTKNAWFIGRVTVEGVPEPPNRGQLVNATRLDPGRPYSEQDSDRAIENLRQTLSANGFYESRIQPQLERDPGTQQVHIRFVVEHGPRAEYRRPSITGHPERPVNHIVDATGWRSWMGLLGWRSVTEARTQRGVERVRRYYQKRDYLMARVTLGKLQYEPDTKTVIPALNIEAGDRIAIRARGAKLSGGRLRQLVPVYEEQSVDRDLLVEGMRNITEYFQARGYFHTKVDFQSSSPNGNQRLIEYEINRGERHKVVAVTIEGNKYFDEATIRERMFVRPASFLSLRHGRYSDELIEQDRDAIAELYRSNGFRDVRVVSRVEHGYRGKEELMAVRIRIEEGAQWRVAKLDIEGASPERLEEIRGMLQSIEDQPFSDANVAIDRENILRYYYDRGYPDGNLEWSSREAAEPHRVDLRYVIHEGPQRFVRDVLVSGLDATDPTLVKNRLLLDPGDPLSQSRLLETQRRLYDLGIFARADMALQNPEGDERSKYVLLQMEESRKYTVAGGVGAELGRIGGSRRGFEDPAGRTGFSPRVALELTRRNFLGNGHTVGFKSRVSTLQQRGLATYIAPQFRGDPDINLTFTGLYDRSRDVRTFDARRFEGSVQIGQRLSRANTMLYRVTYRQVGIDEDTLRIDPRLIDIFSQPVRLGILGGSFIQDRRDDPTDSSRGIYNTVDFGLASKLFGSGSDFLRLLGRNSTYHRVRPNWVLARTLTFGWLQTLGEGQDIPLPERFFSGGASSHRGFPDNQAGPRDLITGFPLGGKAVLMSGVELRFPLLGENIGGVLFHDAGNVYSGLDKLSLRVEQRDLSDFNYMVHAVGFGIRYRTPIGPIRVDVAYAPNAPHFVGFQGTREELLFGPTNGNGPLRTLQRISRFQFHFSLGQTF